MTAGLKRHYGKGDLHFVTFSCYQRRPLLDSEQARNLLVRELARVREEAQFGLVGYVAMPDHVHLLMSEPQLGTPSTVLHDLKLRVSRGIRKGLRNPGSKGEPGAPEKQENAPRAFWQARFYDFNVYSSAKVREKLEYMHGNPVQRRLVEHPKDWPWSSWSFYSGLGTVLIPMDEIR